MVVGGDERGEGGEEEESVGVRGGSERIVDIGYMSSGFGTLVAVVIPSVKLLISTPSLPGHISYLISYLLVDYCEFRISCFSVERSYEVYRVLN